MKEILSEGGIRNINQLKKDFKNAKIFYHIDLDGVTSALAMKKYLEDKGFKVIGCEGIQYGDKEYSVEKSDPAINLMNVLVDFAHGKPMFHIMTDHHDRQAGVEKDTSTSFRHARSNVETLSQIIPTAEIFPPEDVKIISMVDSADYARNEVTPEMVMNYIFDFDKDKGLANNKLVLGLVTNKMLLAFKNKPQFLDTLVMECKPSLMSIYQKISQIIKDKGWPGRETLEKNKETYVASMKNAPNVKVDGPILVQYGGGNMMKPGSYDRYTPFRNNPEADFLVIAWPLGLLQASCNPFKKERELKGVNLGEIAQEVLGKWEDQLKQRDVKLSTIKWISESSKDFGEQSVGFTYKDFLALYSEKYRVMENGEKFLDIIFDLMEKPFSNLSEKELEVLDNITVPAWDLIQANSGGHKCITNISGLNFLGRSTRPPSGGYKYNAEKDDSPYIKFLKMLQNEFVKVLKNKISESKSNKSLEENIIEKVKRKILKEQNTEPEFEDIDVEKLKENNITGSFLLKLLLIIFGIKKMMSPEGKGFLQSIKDLLTGNKENGGGASDILGYPLGEFKSSVCSSCGYGALRRGGGHAGIDLTANSGTEVLAPLDGEVTDAAIRNDSCGGTLEINHGNVGGHKTKTRYCHLKEIKVSKGDKVKKGDVVAISGGATGDKGKGAGSGAHLHFELYKDGKHLNPKDYVLASDESGRKKLWA